MQVWVRLREDTQQQLTEHESVANARQRLLRQQHADVIVRLKREQQASVASHLEEAAAAHSTAVAALVAKHQQQADSLAGQLELEKESSGARLAACLAQLTSAEQHALDLGQQQADLHQQHSVLLAAHDAAVQASEESRHSHEAQVAQIHIKHRCCSWPVLRPISLTKRIRLLHTHQGSVEPIICV